MKYRGELIKKYKIPVSVESDSIGNAVQLIHDNDCDFGDEYYSDTEIVLFEESASGDED